MNVKITVRFFFFGSRIKLLLNIIITLLYKKILKHSKQETKKKDALNNELTTLKKTH